MNIIRQPQRDRRGQRGFTLIETMAALSIAGVLSSIALPSFQGQIHKTRRADVHVALMQVQMAQERWRSNSDAYGTLTDIGQGAASPNGHYAISIASPTGTGYAILASARSSGAQAGDTPCLHMKATITGGNVSYASGPNDEFANTAAANRACWGQ